MGTIDLHIHTKASDGTDSAEELLAKLQQEGITTFAVTDHDGVAAVEDLQRIFAQQKGAFRGMTFISGIEFSCADKDGKYHILGYGFSADAKEVQRILSGAHETRMKKVASRLLFLKDTFGFTFRKEDEQAFFALTNPGKPHLARLMVEYGYASSIDDAIEHYINKQRMPVHYIRPEDAIRAIQEGRGIPVLAHPFLGDGNQQLSEEALEERIRKLIGFGLRGIEAYYPRFTPKQVQKSLFFAQKYGLFVTAGSDYHGAHKQEELGKTGHCLANGETDAVTDFVQYLIAERKALVL